MKGIYVFLPVSRADLVKRKIKQLDFVYVCGDAYVDHPSFGAAIICRLLELNGYSVGIIARFDRFRREVPHPPEEDGEKEEKVNFGTGGIKFEKSYEKQLKKRTHRHGWHVKR